MCEDENLREWKNNERAREELLGDGDKKNSQKNIKI